MMFKRYDYYEVIGTTRILRRAKNKQDIQEYVHTKWVSVNEDWRKLKLSWFPETQLKERMRAASVSECLCS